MAGSNKILGKDFKFFLWRDGLPYALCHATDCIIDVDTEKLETTGPNSGTHRTFIPGYIETSISVPAITVYAHADQTVNLDDLEELQENGTIFEFRCGLYADQGKYYQGNAFIQHINSSSVNRGILKFEANICVTGKLARIKKPITKQVYLSNITGVRLAGCPNPYPVGVLWYDNTFIGVANDADEVIVAFNEWAITQGGYVEVITHDDNCNFTINEQWDSPIHPEWIPAVPGSAFVLAGYGIGTVLSGDDIEHILSA